ncbi:MAG: damage-control phosphatase ARMT1 family protein [Chloroflexota bacterium]
MSNPIEFDPSNLPPLLMTGEAGSFANITMTTRIPEIVQNVLGDFGDKFPDDTRQALQALQAEILNNQRLQPLQTQAPDKDSWSAACRPYLGQRWFDLPWYFAETFFYRRLLEAVGYFGESEWAGVDPFLPRKQAELRGEAPWQILSMALEHSRANADDSFRLLLHHGVWGNRLDLSYTQVARAASGQIAVEQEQANLLIDDTAAVWSHLQHRGQGRIDFISDNSGTELLMDLALADFLLRFDWAEQITLHVKAHPTYVSDTIPADVDLTIAALNSQQAVELQALARRLTGYQRLRVRADYFWNSSRFFWELPVSLQEDLARANLVIVKGDANYRRLIGDCRWPTTSPLAERAPYFPTSLVALRTMKSDPIVGLRAGQAEALDQIDAAWRVNGKRGVIQAVLKNG